MSDHICHHPQTRARRERALVRREAQLKRYEAGDFSPMDDGSFGLTEEIQKMKVQRAITEIADLKAKL